MNRERILSVIRHVLTLGAGILVAKGTLEQGQVEIVAGGITGLIGVVWGVLSKKVA